jgi:hypothetical protein
LGVWIPDPPPPQKFSWVEIFENAEDVWERGGP